MMARAIVEIDMVTPALAVHDPAAYSGAGLTWHRLYVDQRVPCVEASFEGHSGVFRLDTGAAPSTVAFHAPAVERLKLLEGRATNPSMAAGVGGAIPAREGELAWFEIAGRRHEHVEATFISDGKGALADPYTLGNLGGELLKPFRLVMDYQKGRIAYVER
jgi:hypothetical protein